MQTNIEISEGSFELFGILLVGPTGRLAMLHCPFVVLCIRAVGDLVLHSYPIVHTVGTTESGRLVFFISGKAYYHSNFRILIEL